MPRFFDILGMGGQDDALMRVFSKAGEMMPQQVANLVNVISDKVAETWAADAEKASPWGSKYAQAIRVEPMTSAGGGFAKVYIDENVVDARSDKPAILFVNMMEKGMQPFSIKEGLLASKRAKKSNDGITYIIVPFRWRTPAKTKKSSQFVGVMPSDVYAIVKGGVQLKGSQYGHMAGLVKFEKAHQSTYFTFRVCSEKSQGWQHPGKDATPVYEKVLRKVDAMIKQAIETYCEAVVKKLEVEGSK